MPNAKSVLLLGAMCQDPATRHSENFKTQSANEVTAFHSNLLGFETVLQELGADKGLANYDRSDDLETLLKDLVNANKYLLSDIDDLVYDIPGLGSTLGPSEWSLRLDSFLLMLPQLYTRSNVFSTKSWMQ